MYNLQQGKIVKKGSDIMVGEHQYKGIACSCPKYESVQWVQGYGLNLANVSSRPSGPRCENCVHWNLGGCELFLAKGK